MLWQLIVSSLTVGSIYALTALGFSVVFAATRIMNIAHGQFVMLGAMFGVSYFVSMRVPYWATIVLVFLTVGVIGVAMERLTIRPIQKGGASLLALIIATVAVGEMFANGAPLAWGVTDLYSPPPLGTQPLVLVGAATHTQSLVILALTAVSFGSLWVFFERTVLGKSVRAVAIDPFAARVVGINVELVSLLVFGLAAALGGVAGLAISPITNASPHMGLGLTIKGVTAAIIGGFGSLGGALLGGMALGFLEMFVAGFITPAFRDAIVFGILLAVLFLRPSGILSRT